MKPGTRKFAATLVVGIVLFGFLRVLDFDWKVLMSGDPQMAVSYLRERVQTAGHWKYPLFVFLFVIPPLALVPISAIVLATALIFRPAEAYILIVVGFAANTVFCFGLARWLGRAWVEENLMGNWDTLKRVDEDSGDWGFGVAVLWRFLPVPYAWPSLAAGITRMRLGALLGGTVLISLFWAGFYVVFAGSIVEGSVGKAMTGVGLLAALMYIGWMVRRVKAAGRKNVKKIKVELPPLIVPLDPPLGPVLDLYSNPGDELSEVARQELWNLRETLKFEIRETDLSKDAELARRWLDQSPMVLLDGVMLFNYQVDDYVLKIRLEEKAAGITWTGGNTWDDDKGQA